MISIINNDNKDFEKSIKKEVKNLKSTINKLKKENKQLEYDGRCVWKEYFMCVENTDKDAYSDDNLNVLKKQLEDELIEMKDALKRYLEDGDGDEQKCNINKLKNHIVDIQDYITDDKFMEIVKSFKKLTVF